MVERKQDVAEAERKITRPTEQPIEARAGKVVAGRREELTLNPTAQEGPKSETEEALKRATDSRKS